MIMPAFAVSHRAKDFDLALKAGFENGAAMPANGLEQRLYGIMNDEGRKPRGSRFLSTDLAHGRAGWNQRFL